MWKKWNYFYLSKCEESNKKGTWGVNDMTILKWMAKIRRPSSSNGTLFSMRGMLHLVLLDHDFKALQQH